MPGFTAVDLSQLPAPDVVESLDFETIFAAMQTMFTQKIGVTLIGYIINFSISVSDTVGNASGNGTVIWRIARIMFELAKTQHHRRVMA